MAVEFLPGNRLTLLRSGVEYFPALEAAIREARREIFLETYIYAGDATGERITKPLAKPGRGGGGRQGPGDASARGARPARSGPGLRTPGRGLPASAPDACRFP